jgi:galactonate dehydratase
MYRQPFFRAGGIGMSALSGIEIACWDIFGQSVGRPIYQLLGGWVRDRIWLYDHLGDGEMESLYLDDTAEVMATRARQSVEGGYTDGGDPRGRGADVDVMVDLHARTTPDMAI